MRLQTRHAFVLAALAAAIAACTLNPQPLPPGDLAGVGGGSDASTRAEGGSFDSDPETPPSVSDAGANSDSDSDTGGDGGDAGDGGDGGITDAASDG